MRRPDIARRPGYAALGAIAIAAAAEAHSPVLSCYEEKDATIVCEGGFSDGGSAEGVALRVLDARNKVLIDGKMDKSSTFKFKKPGVDYHVVFDAGDSHVVTIYGGDITE
jgi:hypothetical protein